MLGWFRSPKKKDGDDGAGGMQQTKKPSSTGKRHKVHLGEKENKFYYNEKLKRWCVEGEEGLDGENDGALSSPPKQVTSTSGFQSETYAGGEIYGQQQQHDGGNFLPFGGATSEHPPQGFRGRRGKTSSIQSRYVDAFGTETNAADNQAKAKGNASLFAPPTASLMSSSNSNAMMTGSSGGAGGVSMFVPGQAAGESDAYASFQPSGWTSTNEPLDPQSSAALDQPSGHQTQNEEEAAPVQQQYYPEAPDGAVTGGYGGYGGDEAESMPPAAQEVTSENAFASDAYDNSYNQSSSSWNNNDALKPQDYPEEASNSAPADHAAAGGNLYAPEAYASYQSSGWADYGAVNPTAIQNVPPDQTGGLQTSNQEETQQQEQQQQYYPEASDGAVPGGYTGEEAESNKEIEAFEASAADAAVDPLSSWEQVQVKHAGAAAASPEIPRQPSLDIYLDEHSNLSQEESSVNNDEFLSRQQENVQREKLARIEEVKERTLATSEDTYSLAQDPYIVRGVMKALVCENTMIREKMKTLEEDMSRLKAEDDELKSQLDTVQSDMNDLLVCLGQESAKVQALLPVAKAQLGEDDLDSLLAKAEEGCQEDIGGELSLHAEQEGDPSGQNFDETISIVATVESGDVDVAGLKVFESAVPGIAEDMEGMNGDNEFHSDESLAEEVCHGLGELNVGKTGPDMVARDIDRGVNGNAIISSDFQLEEGDPLGQNFDENISIVATVESGDVDVAGLKVFETAQLEPSAPDIAEDIEGTNDGTGFYSLHESVAEIPGAGPQPDYSMPTMRNAFQNDYDNDDDEDDFFEEYARENRTVRKKAF